MNESIMRILSTSIDPVMQPDNDESDCVLRCTECGIFAKPQDELSEDDDCYIEGCQGYFARFD